MTEKKAADWGDIGPIDWPTSYTSGGVNFDPVVTRVEIDVHQNVFLPQTYRRVRAFSEAVRRLKRRTAYTIASGLYAKR